MPLEADHINFKEINLFSKIKFYDWWSVDSRELRKIAMLLAMPNACQKFGIKKENGCCQVGGFAWKNKRLFFAQSS